MEREQGRENQSKATQSRAAEKMANVDAGQINYYKPKVIYRPMHYKRYPSI